MSYIYYEPGVVDFENPEHQKELLQGKEYLVCQECGANKWIYKHDALRIVYIHGCKTKSLGASSFTL